MKVTRVACVGCSKSLRSMLERAEDVVVVNEGDPHDAVITPFESLVEVIERYPEHLVLAVRETPPSWNESRRPLIIGERDVPRLASIIRRELRRGDLPGRGSALVATAGDSGDDDPAGALRRSEERYRAVVEQANDIIFTTDAAGFLTSVNRAFDAITGWNGQKLIGHSLTELLDPAAVPVAVEHFRRVSHGETVTADYEVRAADGTILTLETRARGLIVEGNTAGVVGVARDVTAGRERAARAEKERRLESLGHLAGAVAHEFNNVLMSILPFAELIRRRYPDDERCEMATGHIVDAVHRGRQVSQQILRFARTSALSVAPVNIKPWLAGLTDDAKALLGPRYTVTVKVPTDEEIWILGDRSLLDQIMTNLLLNARDAMPEGGPIEIEMRRSSIEPGNVEVAVRDHGEGIAPHLIERVFDPLYTTRSGRSGLGLSTALQAMAEQEGTIRVTSDEGGSVFTLVFRRAEPPEAAHPRSVEDHSLRRILVVEDDEAVGEGLRALLMDDGFEVRLVTSASEAVSAAEEFQPDVTVLDVNLGEMTGVEVFDKLTARWPDIRVIFSTGHADASALDDVRRKGVPAIMKPYEVADLVALIDNFDA